jgi:two-component sensor histidine kinase
MTTYEAAYVLPPTVDSIARARAVIRDLDVDLGPDVVDDAELLVSEVVTNAIRHGGPTIRLDLAADGAGLTVRVYDGARTMPVPRHPDVDVPSGRGLQIVERVASAWGIVLEPTGKTVWFRIDHGHDGHGHDGIA